MHHRTHGMRWAALACAAHLGALAAATFSIPPAVPPVAEPFAAGAVQLLDGPFKRAEALDHRYLLRLEPDRLLSWFRKEAGLPHKAEPYGGWELQGVAGHSLGHYLTACAYMFRATGDARLKQRADYAVGELAACQEANGNGYLAAIPRGKELFAEVARGDIRSQGFDLNGGWVPWYTLHKLFAGLRDVHLWCDNAQAKVVLLRLSDWAVNLTRGLDDAQWQRMLACEHGGMNEVLGDAYALSGDARYLDLARQFHHRAILDPLAAGRDELAGKHANTQIPKLIGAARLHALTGDAAYAAMSAFFWERVTQHHSYVIGGNSDGEHFGAPDQLNRRLSDSTCETCNTYNMLKLTAALFSRNPQAGYADYAERALWNHILASQHPEDGRVCYFVPLKSGSYKTFMTPFDSFTCCTGTGMENHARYGEGLFFHTADSLYVNQFIPAEVRWADRRGTLRLETEFPHSGKVRLLWTADLPSRFTLRLRHPAWAPGPLRVRVNGAHVRIASQPASFLELQREWQNGDRVELELPLALRTEPMPDNPSRVAVLWGPIVLAGDLGPQDAEPQIPVLVTEGRPVRQWLRPVRGETLRFRTRNVGRPADLTLQPFHGIHGRRHAVYWDLFTKAEWRQREANLRAEEARLKALEARTVDVLRIGEMQPERDHLLQGEHTSAGEAFGRKWRHATDGGWFGFELKALPHTAQELVVTYWGSDGGGNRTFDVLVNGRKIATQTLERNQPDQFFDVAYPIPATLVQGLDRITVRFQAHPGKWAGGVFGVRLLRAP